MTSASEGTSRIKVGSKNCGPAAWTAPPNTTFPPLLTASSTWLRTYDLYRHKSSSGSTSMLSDSISRVKFSDFLLAKQSRLPGNTYDRFAKDDNLSQTKSVHPRFLFSIYWSRFTLFLSGNIPLSCRRYETNEIQLVKETVLFRWPEPNVPEFSSEAFVPPQKFSRIFCPKFSKILKISSLRQKKADGKTRHSET